MNNENNNGMSNGYNNRQPMMNTQSLNNQPINNGGYNNQYINNQPVMNTQSLSNQPINNDGYNGQNINNQQNNTPIKKDNKMLFMILGIVALIVVAVVVLVVVLSKNSSKGNTINDFEDNGTLNNENNDTDKNDNSITFKGFSIPKQIGYEYEVDFESGLIIGNSNFATMVQVTYGTLETIKSKKDEFVSGYTNANMNPTNVKIANYGGKEALTIELSIQGRNTLFYAIDAGSNYSFIGFAMNPSFVIDYNDIKTSVSLLSKAKYTGTYKASTDDVNIMEFKNLFE